MGFRTAYLGKDKRQVEQAGVDCPSRRGGVLARPTSMAHGRWLHCNSGRSRQDEARRGKTSPGSQGRLANFVTATGRNLCA
jgi:hypothetical protein